MSVAVRRAEAVDGPGLYRAWTELRNHYGSADRRLVLAAVTEEEFIADLAESLARGTAATFIAEEGDRIVGFASASIEANQPDRLPEHHATLGHLYVEREYRRAGVGRQLFDRVARWAETFEGVSHCEMAVLAADEGAEAFWRALGFTPFIQRLWVPLEADDRR